MCTSCGLVFVIWYGILFLFWFFRQHFGCNHPKYADTLIDYGYYLLNVDAINLSVKVYRVSISKHLSCIQVVKTLVLPGFCKTLMQPFFIAKQYPWVLCDYIKERLHRRLTLSINFKELSAEKNHYQRKQTSRSFSRMFWTLWTSFLWTIRM